MTTSRLGIPITGEPAQALLQIQQAIGSTFGRRDVPVEFVRDGAGTLIELQVIFGADVPTEEILGFRRALAVLAARTGAPFTVPTGSGGAVGVVAAFGFEGEPDGGAPVGFTTGGAVTVTAVEAGALETGSTYDLVGVDLTPGDEGINPGSVSITLVVDGVTETITDDGLGALTGTNGSLPGDGTVDYVTGEMTGETAALDGLSAVAASYEQLTGVGPTAIESITPAATYDLSTTPLTTGDDGIQPGSVSIAVTMNVGGAQTITDDGLGVLTGTGACLPGDGTIDYDTGAMTGTTAELADLSEVVVTYNTLTEVGPTNLTTVGSASGVGATELSSGAAAGTASLRRNVERSVGGKPASMTWAFALNFPDTFGLNNNGEAGAKALTLEARLFALLEGGSDVVLRWEVESDDAVPPVAWGTPVFAVNTPTTAPTADLAVPITGDWVNVEIALAGPRDLDVTVDGTTERFRFAQDIVVPSGMELRHTWGAALDRHFVVDAWGFEFSLPTPPV